MGQPRSFTGLWSLPAFKLLSLLALTRPGAALLFPDVKVHDSASFGSHLGNVAQIQECASRTWPILNLGMLFSNKCSVRLNIRRMDRFISTIILVVKPGWLKLAPALGRDVSTRARNRSCDQ